MAPPEKIPAKQALAALLAARNFHELTVRAAEELEHAPCDPDILNFVAVGLMYFGRTGGALDKLQKTLSIDPSNDFALLGVGLILQQKVSAEAAAPYFQSLFAIKKDGFFDAGGEQGVRMSGVTTFERWSAAQGEVVYFPPQDVTVVNSATGTEEKYHSDAVRGVTVPAASVIGGWDFVISPDGEVIEGSGFNDLSVLFKLVRHVYSPETQRVVHLWPPQCVEVDEDALFLSGVTGPHFGHWVSDFLPRLIGWRRDGARPPKIAAARVLDRHQCDTLALFGVRESDIIWCDVGQRYRFRSLHVIQHGDIYRPHPEVTRFRYRGLGPKPAAQPSKRALGRRFFLERSGTPRGRFIANRAEMNEVLAEANFETIRRPEIPIAQQNAMFQEADIILSVFGSDLMTVYQLRPGADVVVLDFDRLRRENFVTVLTAFDGICAAIGVRVHYVACAPTQNEKVKSDYGQDVIVDCDALRACLDEIIMRRSLEYAGN